MGSFSVIITAGGIGARMNASLPKQFLLIKERPLLMYTIELFYQFNPKSQLILTLPDDWIEYWEDQLVEHDFEIPHRVIAGGKERYHSIKNALQYCQSEFVAVHDGVRPLVSNETLTRCFEAVRKNDAVIPVMPVSESLRIIQESHSHAVDRSQYLIVQTPQCFRTSVLKKAYEKEYHQTVTDDACLVEEAGYQITLVDGNPENIKITRQSDLRLAEMFLN